MDHLTFERLNALTEAAANGQTKDVIPLLENLSLINGKDENGCTPLYRACFNGRNQTAFELLRRGADANIACENGTKSSLGAAVTQGHPAIVEMLLLHGANADYLHDELTPLHLAVRQKMFSVMVILMRYGANPLFTAKFPTYTFSFGESKVAHEHRTPLVLCKALTWEKGIEVLGAAEDAWSWAGKRGLIAMMNNRAQEKYGVHAETKEDQNIRQTNDELRQKLRQKEFIQSSALWDCPICRRERRDRSSLKCGHVLCPECAKRSIDSSNKCPFCQQAACLDDIRRLYFQ